MADRFEPVIAEYLQELRVSKRYSPHTLANYQRDLKVFATAAESRGIQAWNEIDGKMIRAIVAEQHMEGVSGRSLARRLSALRGLLNYMLKLGLVDSNPAADVLAPKGKRKLPATLDADEVSRLLKENLNDPMICRDLAMFELMYSSGLRLSELVSIDLVDLDLSVGQVRVTGKGGKTRDLPVGKHAIQAINKWLVYRRTLPGSNETAVFILSLIHI